MLVEAMACSVPVVGAQSGAIPEVIGEAGMTFPEGDVEALADCLKSLMRDEGLRRRLSEAGRERVLKRYTQAQIARRTVDVYREMAAPQG